MIPNSYPKSFDFMEVESSTKRTLFFKYHTISILDVFRTIERGMNFVKTMMNVSQLETDSTDKVYKTES